MPERYPCPVARPKLVLKRIPLGDDEWLAVGNDGWLLWHHPEVDEDVRARVERRGPSWVVTALSIGATQAGQVKASHLRLLNLGRAEAAVSNPDHRLLMEGEALGGHALAPSSASTEKAYEWARALPLPEITPNLRIAIPPKGQRDFLFYVTVDAVYRRASELFRGPAKAIAEANGVPVSTVHSWLKESRRYARDTAEELAADRAEDAAREKRLKIGLAHLGLTWDEYLERFEPPGSPDPLGVWDEDGYISGPTTADVQRWKKNPPVLPD